MFAGIFVPLRRFLQKFGYTSAIEGVLSWYLVCTYFVI